MGWARGMNSRGEEIGYGVPGICAKPDCDTEIDKGLSYCCGGLGGVEGYFGCGGYFCPSHLFYTCRTRPDVASSSQLCDECDLYGEWEEDLSWIPRCPCDDGTPYIKVVYEEKTEVEPDEVRTEIESNEGTPTQLSLLL